MKCIVIVNRTAQPILMTRRRSFVLLIQVTDWCVDTSGQKQAITGGKLNACGKNILHVGKQRCLAPLRLQGERAVPLSDNRKLGTNGMPKTSLTSFDYVDDVRDIVARVREQRTVRDTNATLCNQGNQKMRRLMMKWGLLPRLL